MNTQLLSRSPADCRVEQSYPCAFTALVAGLLLLVAASAARAQPVDGIQPGEAVVSQFSGTVEQAGRAVIDPSGIVARSIDIRRPGTIPSGQHLSGLAGRVNVLAQDIGQVFGIAFDDAEVPNIYLTATSAFGLHRTSDNRDWMAGMWGSEGGPGSVWRLSAANDYRPELFADITLDGRPNTGAALGNIAYDRHNRQLYVSDLETGMIHRLSVSDGEDLGRYDHGTQGRIRFVDAQTGGTQSLEAIAFDPTSSARLTDCPAGTVTSHASCWNFADFRRRVWGLAVRRDTSTNEVRLYYSVWGSNGFGDPAWFTAGDERRVSVWSVGIAADGAFDSTNVRREFLLPEFFTDPAAVASRGPSHGVSDIAFPKSGTQTVMLVAERGTVRNLGLEAAAPFAHPHEARVIRYERDAQGVWQLSGRYDVGYADRRTLGQPFIRASSAGGVDFGPGYTDAGEVDLAQQNLFAWITGDGLCSEDGPCFDLESRSHSHGLAVHGIQGTDASRVDELAPAAARQPYPASGYATSPETPQSSYMVAAGLDQDRNARGATKIGDVEVYQPIRSPDIQPAEGPWEGPWEEAWPWPVPEGDYPPLPPPPAGEAWPELAVSKTAPAECERGGECTYTMTLTNNGGGTYAGPLYLLDTPPADATFVSASAGWTCEQRPPGGIGCRHEPTTLASGQSVSLTLAVRLPGDIAADVSEVWNCVFIVWPRALDGVAQIRAVEAALLLLGHDPGPVDGVLDAAAQTAIDDYRASVGLPAGGLDELLFEMLFPGSSGMVGDGFPGNDRDCASTRIIGPPVAPVLAFDLGIEKSGPAECERSGECTFEVTVTNRGTEPYEGDLVFADALSTPEPGSAVIVPVPTLVGFEGAGWICTAHPAGATCRFADASLAAGASQSVRITWQVPADYARDQIRNCAGLAWLEMGHENDEDATNDSACSETGIALPAFDIALEKSGPAYCAVGSECTFDVTVTNHGTDPYAGDLVFTDALSTPEPGSALILPVPDLVGFEGDGWNCTAHPAGTTCRHPGATLAAGASETVRITWRVPDPYEQDQIRNCAGLAWPEMGHANDDLAANDSACSETSIGLIAIFFDLIIEHFTECERGALCQAGFRVRNGGEKPFSGAIGIRGSLTPALPIQSVDGAKGGWSCEVSGNTYQCQPRSLRLAPGKTEVMLLRLPVPKDFKGSTIQHDMQIVWPDEKKRDPIPSTDVSSGIIDILDPSSPTESPIDLVVKKRGPTNCSPGANCTYTITVVNQGPGTYRGPIFLNDTYPGYVFDRFVRASAEWNCVDYSGAADCRHDVVTLRERESVTLTLTIRLGENVGDLMENRAAGGARNCAWLRWPGLYPSDERNRHLWVERALAMEGYIGERDIDGTIGTTERRAIRAYQAANGLAPTGAINEDLWRVLFDGIAAIAGDRNSDNDRKCIVTPLFETDLPVCDVGWIPVTRPRAKQLVSEGWQMKQVRRSGRSIMCAKKMPAPTAQPLPSQAAPDLGITKVPTQESCRAGKPCSFAVVTVNSGQGTFSGPLQITDILTPAGARLTQSGSAPWVCRSLRGRVRCNHPATQIAPGESNTLSLAFTTSRNATGVLRNCATIDWSPTARVRAVQRALSQSGFPAGAPDGKAGARTRKAVRDYQKRVGLPVTGRIDNALMRQLFGDWGNGDARADNDRACTDVEIQAADLPPVVAPPPRCEAGWTEMSRERAKILSRRGWQVKRVTRSGRTIWCAQRRTTPPVTPTCTGGRTRNDQGQCVCPSSRPNWTGQRCVACTGGTRWNAQKRACIKPTPTCTSGRIWSPRRNTCVCPANRPHWTGKSCIACTGGTRWNAQKRACIKPTPTCTSGRIWSPRRNTCVCPANKPHWTGKSCVACTGGTRWNAQKRACIKPAPTCTGGRVLKQGKCVCPPSRPVWNGRTCAPRARPRPQAACPSGWVKVSREKAKALVRQGWQIKQVGSNLCARRRTQPRPQLR